MSTKFYLFAVLLLVIPLVAADISSNILAYYKFDEGTGTTTADDTGHGYTGNITNATYTSNFKLGFYALNFTKSPKSSVNTSIQITGNMTLSCWIMPTVDTESQNIIMSNYQTVGSSFNFLWQYFGKNTRFTIGTNSSDGDFNVSTGNYSMASVVVFWNGTGFPNITHYVNGVYKNSSSFSITSQPSPALNTIIGMRASDNTGSNQTLDECGIWNRTLNATDIAELYNSGRGAYPTGTTFGNISIQNITNQAGNSIYTGNVTLANGSIIAYSNLPVNISLLPDGNYTYVISPTGYHSKSQTLESINNTVKYYNSSGFYNGLLYFRGASTGNTYYPDCQLNGQDYNATINATALLQSGTNTINCTGTLHYPFNTDFTWTTTPVNTTFNLTEYQLIMTFRDEINQTQIYENITFDFVATNFTYTNWTLNGNYTIQDMAAGEYTLLYSSPGYVSRTGYIIVPEIPGEVTTKTLYLLRNDSGSSSIEIIIIDQTSLPLPGAVVKAKKHYAGENVYKVVDEELTDQDGTVLLDLFKYNTLYEFVIQYNGQTLLQTVGSTIKKDQITIQVNTVAPTLREWENFNSIDYLLTFSAGTRAFSAIYNNVEGVSTNMCLKSYLVKLSGETLLDTVCSTSGSSTLTTAAVTNVSGATYEGRLYYTDASTGNTYLINKESYTFADDFSSGKPGLLFQIILTLVVIGISIGNPKWILISAPMSLVIGRLLLLNAWPYWMLFGLVVAGLIVLWGVNRR